HRAWHLGAVRTPSIPLEGDRAAAARARPQRADADHRPCHRHPARPDAVRAREALSAGAVPVLDLGAIPRLDDARGHDDRLGPWLHRAVFLAADAGVLQARRAVPARYGGADYNALYAGILPERPHGDR